MAARPAGKARRGVAAKAATRGRPTKYRAEFAEQGRRLALLGLTDGAMAAFFGVTEQTLNNWKRAHMDFFESIQAGKDAADAAVALALYRSAIGDGMVAETKTVTDGDGRVTRTEETRQIPASVQAQSLWLRNRQPQLWRDRVEYQADVALSGPDGSELFHIYNERMQRARERQAAVLAERADFLVLKRCSTALGR
ncbi:hypothetical protein [Burkholderia plantarii]|uniref:hypothetical protein n=1 Tax=Burkholderia plantarii TaxID=41899 RepID=UPI0007C79A7E|nr:hypothetical protein [Burkholderia plantarii]